MGDTKELDYIVRKFRIKPTDKQEPFLLPDFMREDLAKLFAELGYRVGAEIGVNKGAYSAVICRCNAQLKRLYCIDHWHHADRHLDAQQALAQYPCTLIKDSSIAAAAKTVNRSLDFVYIDANHRYPAISADIPAWVLKVRKGGIVAGHDYKEVPGKPFKVPTAVNEYVRAHRIKPWFVLGQNGGSWPSWFWVNQ